MLPSPEVAAAISMEAVWVRQSGMYHGTKGRNWPLTFQLLEALPLLQVRDREAFPH
ncbi:hypothetical protein BQ8794_200097 [Mesorhizobium prunaredense]|uniref:Uncharacterized protein n=1 Tax=Mesorhizobium prunaredense TaxID=1631249 RepID=A0A1R3V5A7_9HYPH|nr:hypothetical protein BQ8794_200097 [Mesorhizobium prunaredense]